MRILSFLFAFAFMAIGFSADAQSNPTVTDNEVSVVIDGTTSRMDLVNIRESLAEYGIDFRYSFQPDNEGRVASIDLTVSVNGELVSGSHSSLQSEGAKISFTVNRATGNTEIKVD